MFWATLSGEFAPAFWIMVVCNFIIPIPILAIRRLRTIMGCVVASCTVLVGMWLERYLIVIASLSYKQLPYSWGTYSVAWPELAIMGASFAAMALLYLLFSKFVPIISIWEMKVDPHTGSI